MEKTYKILKLLIIVLAVAVVIVGAMRLLDPAHTETPEEPAVPAETTSATAPNGAQGSSTSDHAAPDFTVYDIDGNPVKLSDFLGKPVILNFWASWCGPCKAEMPDFEEAYLEYGDTIQFLTVNLTDGRNETVESASEYITQQGYTFPVYYDTALDAAYAYEVNSIPRTYFIDAQGELVYAVTQMITAEQLQAGIDLLLDAE